MSGLPPTTPLATGLGARLGSRFGGLWRHPDFMRLWVGQTISEFGTWLGALYLLAIIVLDASPAQMGLLETFRAAPALLIGLFAGAGIDRLRRRPILIGANIAQAALLTLAALGALAGLVRISHLYLVAFLAGSLTIVFSLAYRAYVPSLVTRPHLVEANSKLEAGASLAEIASPGLGGLLVQLISAPLTLLMDALSFVVSAVLIGAIDSEEPPPAPREGQERLWRDGLTGLRIVVRHPLLRPVAAASATRAFFGGFFAALYGLFVLREIGLSPAALGLLIGAGGLGSLFGAGLTGRVTRSLGWGKTLIASIAAAGFFALLIPLAGGSPLLAAGLLLISQLLGDMASTVYSITDVSLRQAIAPDHLLGRLNAGYEFLVGGIGTVGIAAGGLMGQWLGLRPATAVAAVGIFLAFLWLLFSPLRRLEDLSGWPTVTAD